METKARREEARTNQLINEELSPSHHRHCCVERGLDEEWIKAKREELARTKG